MQAAREDRQRFEMIVDMAGALDAAYSLLGSRIDVLRIPIQGNGQIIQVCWGGDGGGG